MQRRSKHILLGASAVLLLAVAFALYYVSSLASGGAGYGAKVMCAGVFVSGRSPDSIRTGELAFDHPATKLLKLEIQREQRSATATFAGLVSRTAYFRDGLGCTLDLTREQLSAQPRLPIVPNTEAPWPAGGSDDVEPVDHVQLAKALDGAFSEPDPAQPRRTRAVVVVQNGRIVAERYAPGFDERMPLQGWSMTKSVTNALVGVLVGQGKLSVNAPAPVPEWSASNDPRRAITLDQLMQMSSGLKFNESYLDPTTDVAVMLYSRPDAAAYAAARPLASAPGSVWSYSSGTANIISRIIRDAVGGSIEDYWGFPRRALFDRIGMRSAIMEPDASGVFVGSSFLYATARDWARFGLLYLNDGVWNGERILPEGWVRYSTAAAPKAPQGRYGAQIWLNAGDAGNPSNRPWPNLPTDIYNFSGFEGQHVVIVPSKRLVVVRLGLSQEPSTWSLREFLTDLLRSGSQNRR